MRRLAVLPLLLTVIGPAACGAERTPPPDLDASLRTPLERRDFPEAGLSLELPNRVLVERRPAPEVFRAGIGDWVMGAFAYPRDEQLPRTARELDTARRRLIAQVRDRDPRYRLVRSKVTRLAGAPAVELVGDQTLSRVRVRTRSLHVYKGRGEYVIEMGAGVGRYTRLNRRLFARIVRSLDVTGRIHR